MEKIEISQFVTFKVSNELLGIEVSKVREILEVPRITEVPGMPEAFSGIINNRGDIIPILDLRKRFYKSNISLNNDTSIIIVETNNINEIILLGIIVDCAEKVVSLEKSDIEISKKLKEIMYQSYVKGIGKTNDEMIIILDVDSLILNNEIDLIKEINC